MFLSFFCVFLSLFSFLVVKFLSYSSPQKKTSDFLNVELLTSLFRLITLLFLFFFVLFLSLLVLFLTFTLTVTVSVLCTVFGTCTCAFTLKPVHYIFPVFFEGKSVLFHFSTFFYFV